MWSLNSCCFVFSSERQQCIWVRSVCVWSVLYFPRDTSRSLIHNTGQRLLLHRFATVVWFSEKQKQRRPREGDSLQQYYTISVKRVNHICTSTVMLFSPQWRSSQFYCLIVHFLCSPQTARPNTMAFNEPQNPHTWKSGSCTEQYPWAEKHPSTVMWRVELDPPYARAAAQHSLARQVDFWDYESGDGMDGGWCYGGGGTLVLLNLYFSVRRGGARGDLHGNPSMEGRETSGMSRASYWAHILCRNGTRSLGSEGQAGLLQAQTELTLKVQLDIHDVAGVAHQTHHLRRTFFSCEILRSSDVLMLTPLLMFILVWLNVSRCC